MTVAVFQLKGSHLKRLEYNIVCWDFHHGKRFNKLLHLFWSLEISSPWRKLSYASCLMERLDLFGYCHSSFTRSISRGQKMAESIFTSWKVLILVPEPQTDTSSKAAECLDVTGGRFSLSCIGYQPHDAAPLLFLKLHGCFRFLVRPDKGHRVIFQMNCLAILLSIFASLNMSWYPCSLILWFYRQKLDMSIWEMLVKVKNKTLTWIEKYKMAEF